MSNPIGTFSVQSNSGCSATIPHVVPSQFTQPISRSIRNGAIDVIDDKESGDDSAGGTTAFSTFKYDDDMLRKAVAKMIIVDKLPLSFLESEGFQDFMSVACPHIQIPSRFAVLRECYQLYADKKRKLRQLLKDNCHRVCLSTNTWISDQGINYMSLTASFIDSKWSLKKLVLSFFPVESHEGEKVATAIEKCLIEWEISGVVSVTLDNSSANDVTVASLKNKMREWKGSILACKYIHVRCIAHIINTFINDGLRSMGRAVYRIRNAVRYVRQCPVLFQKFKEFVAAEGLPSKALLYLDIPNRWSSALMMLESASRFESIFYKISNVDDHFKICSD